MNNSQLLKIVEQYSRKNVAQDGEIKVTRVPDQKTVFVEQFDEIGRSVILREYKVDEKIFWAGYSSRSETVYVSLAK